MSPASTSHPFLKKKKKTTRLRRSRVDDPTLPGSRGTSLTDCRTTAVLTASVCTRNHDPDAEPNCFSSMFLLGMSWCSDCDAAFLSLRGGVQKKCHPDKHQLRKVVQASTENSALRQQQNNVKSQKSTSGGTNATGLHKLALAVYCLCQCHTGPCTRILGHRSRCVSTLDAVRFNPWTLKSFHGVG